MKTLVSDPEGNGKTFPFGPCMDADSVCKKMSIIDYPTPWDVYSLKTIPLQRLCAY